MPLPKFVPAAILALSLAAVGAVTALAHGGAEGVVKERMDLMEGMGDAVKAIAAMMRGKTDYDPERLRALAGEIETQAGEAITGLFPEGTGHAPSEATPEIWTDWDEFEALAVDLQTRAGKLAAAAGPDEPPMDAFKAMGAVCRDCHQDFRAEE